MAPARPAEISSQSAGARACLRVRGLVWGAWASAGCQGQFGMPGLIWVACTNLGCQGQSGLPKPVCGDEGARASLGCQDQSKVDAATGTLPSCLCNLMCCAMLLCNNGSALVSFYFDKQSKSPMISSIVYHTLTCKLKYCITFHINRKIYNQSEEISSSESI